MGIVPNQDKESVTHNQLDVLTSTLIGYFYLADEAIGNEKVGMYYSGWVAKNRPIGQSADMPHF